MLPIKKKTIKLESELGSLSLQDEKEGESVEKKKEIDFLKDNNLLKDIFFTLDKLNFGEEFKRIGTAIRWYLPRKNPDPISVKKIRK